MKKGEKYIHWGKLGHLHGRVSTLLELEVRVKFGYAGIDRGHSWGRKSRTKAEWEIGVHYWLVWKEHDTKRA